MEFTIECNKAKEKTNLSWNPKNVVNNKAQAATITGKCTEASGVVGDQGTDLSSKVVGQRTTLWLSATVAKGILTETENIFKNRNHIGDKNPTVHITIQATNIDALSNGFFVKGIDNNYEVSGTKAKSLDEDAFTISANHIKENRSKSESRTKYLASLVTKLSLGLLRNKTEENVSTESLESL